MSWSRSGQARWDWQAPEADAELRCRRRSCQAALGEAYRITEKAARYERVGEVAGELSQLAAEDGPAADDVKDVFKTLEKNIVRSVFWRVSRALMAAITALCERLPARWMYCLRHTVQRSSLVVKLRLLVQ